VARQLGPQNRGYFALLILWPVVLTALGGLGVPASLPFFIASNPAGARQVIHAISKFAFIQIACLVAMHAGILMLFLRGKPQQVVIAGLLSIFTVPASLGIEYVLATLQGQQRYKAFNVLRVVPTTWYTVAVLGSFVLRHGDLPIVMLSWVSSYLMAVLIGIALLHRSLPRGQGNPVPLKHLLRFSVVGLLGSISPIETFRLDQAVIGILLSPLALGLYVVALAFTNLPRFLAQSIGAVAYPHIAARAHQQNRERLVWQFFAFSSIACTLVVVSLVLAVPVLLPAFFGKPFAAAIPLAQILLIGSLFLSARRTLTDGARGLGLPSLGTIAELGSWLWLLPALTFLTPRLGLRGVAWAFATAAVLSLLVAGFWLSYRLRTPFMRDRPKGEGSILP
jgi:O-antigen/teichoic acid export membrane protein